MHNMKLGWVQCDAFL